jgi:hypothetical protein
MTFTIPFNGVLKPGFYKTRDGRKVEIIAVNVRGRQPILGYIRDNNGLDSWTVDGRCYGEDKDADIVSEWREPVKYSVDIYMGGSPKVNDTFDFSLSGYLMGGEAGWSKVPQDGMTKYRITVEGVEE